MKISNLVKTFLYFSIGLCVICITMTTQGGVASAVFSFEPKSMAENENNGEIVLKYLAPELDWDNATKKEIKELEKIGWVLEDGVPVLYRDMREFLEQYAHQHSDHVHSHSKHEESAYTVLINGAEQESYDGTFKIEDNSMSTDIEIEGFTDVTTTQDSEGNYQAIIEINLSEVLDMHSPDSNENVKLENSSIGVMNHSSMHFSPPPHGTYKYKVGDRVHCNRFNGPRTDHYHYAKDKAQAYINFYMSDCDHGVGAGLCKYASDVCNREKQFAYCSLMLGHITRYHLHY